MSLADLLERLLIDDPGLTPDELYQRLGRAQSKVRGASVVDTVLTAQRDRFVQSSPGRYSSTKQVEPVAEEGSLQPGWRELERDLRSQLRGCRMVAEIGLGAALHQEVMDGLGEACQDLPGPGEVARDARALLVVGLVGHGIYYYELGSFWGDIPVKGLAQSYGPAFLRALELLNLETFADMVAEDRALRYVAPILAHGGIPKRCLPDFFGLMDQGFARGAGDATDLLAFWRARGEAFRASKPVRRFLLFGGELAHDFLDRCIDLFREWSRSKTLLSSDEAGLPAYVLTGFRRLASAGALKAGTATSRRAQRPSLRPKFVCDPWDLGGPSITLPAVESQAGASYWTISSPSGVRREVASRTADKSVTVGPDRQWEVRLISDGDLRSETVFEGLDDVPALFIDSTSMTLIPQGRSIRGEDVLVLRPYSQACRWVRAGDAEDVRVIEELPELSGAWSGFRMDRIDLRGCEALIVGGQDGARERRVSVRSFERPTLGGQILDGATAGDGVQVLVADAALTLPASSIGWTVKLTVDGETITTAHPGGQRVDLTTRLPLDRAAPVSLLARGALGSDLRCQFVWVPGLALSRPERLALPNEPPPTIRVSSPVVALVGAAFGEELVAKPEGDGDSITFKVEAAGGAVTIRVRVPRLRWGLIREGRCEFGTAQAPMSALDVTGSNPPGLAVSTGERDLPIELSLSIGGEERQRSEHAMKTSAVGQCRFDLGRFADTVGSLAESAELNLLIGWARRSVPIAKIVPHYEFVDLEIESIGHSGQRLLDIRVKESRPVKGRVLRLWSVGRLWEEPYCISLPDESIGGTTLLLDPAPPPGEYLAELLIDDGWTVAVRPGSVGRGVVAVGLGGGGEAWSDLQQRAVDDPLTVIESINAWGVPVRELTEAELEAVLLEAVQSWTVINRSRSRRAREQRAAAALVAMIARAHGSLPSVVDELAGIEELDRSELLRLAVALAPLVVPGGTKCSDEELRPLWQLATGLATIVGFDLGVDSDTRNPEEFLGWSPASGVEALPVAPKIEQLWLGMELEQFDAVSGILQKELLPKPLTLDGGVEANLQWLRAEKASVGPTVSSWMSSHHRLLNHPAPTSEWIVLHLSSRAAAVGAAPWGAFPQLTLAAALHVCGDTDLATTSQAALDSAIEFAPLQVRRDLILARVLTADLLATYELDSLPTQRMNRHA